MEDIHSDAMICADCFRAQSEGRSANHHCHNSKCHFYGLSTVKHEETAVYGSSSRSVTLPYRERSCYKSTDSALGADDLWTYKPSTKKQRAKMVTFAIENSRGTGHGGFVGPPSRPQSTSDMSSQPADRLQPGGAPWYRSRILSTPSQNAAEERHMLEDDPFYQLHVSPMTQFLVQNGYHSRTRVVSFEHSTCIHVFRFYIRCYTAWSIRCG